MRMHSLPMWQPVGDGSGASVNLHRHTHQLSDSRNLAPCSGHAIKIRTGGAEIFMLRTIAGE
jgi:hypothetical protein